MVSFPRPSQTPFDEVISIPVSQAIALLHQQIPQSAVVTDWLTTHNDQLVVRATVHVGTTPLASAMAMASTIEAAEDQAKVRAIASALAPYLNQLSESNQALVAISRSHQTAQNVTAQDVTTQDVTTQSDAPENPPVYPRTSPEQIPTPKHPSHSMADQMTGQMADQPSDQPSVSTTHSQRSAQDSAESPPPEEDDVDNDWLHSMDTPDAPPPISSLDIEETLDPQEQVVESDSSPGQSSPSSVQKPQKKQSRKKATSTPSSTQKSPPSTPEAASQSPSSPSQTDSSPRSLSIDLSDIIAKTSVELKRLGWTDSQGREHLQKTYGKRSRQHLTDPELLDFLTYLESLDS